MAESAVVTGGPRWWRQMFRMAGAVGLFGLAVAAAVVALVRRNEPSGAPWTAESIVVLAGASERAWHARSLVEKGVAPRLFSTAADPKCIRAGGSPDTCSSGVRSSVDEAVFLRRVLPSEGMRRVVVVTSGYHQLRASIIFWIIFVGSETQVRVMGTPDAGSGRLVAGEAMKTLPSVAAALVGRLFLRLYESVAQRVHVSRQRHAVVQGAAVSR